MIIWAENALGNLPSQASENEFAPCMVGIEEMSLRLPQPGSCPPWGGGVLAEQLPFLALIYNEITDYSRLLASFSIKGWTEMRQLKGGFPDTLERFNE